MVDVALTTAGLIRVRTHGRDACGVPGVPDFRSMAGPHLGVITATGAFGIIAADACEDYGLELAPFPNPSGTWRNTHRLAQAR